MKQYRIFVKGPEGHFLRSHDFMGFDDQDAMIAARAYIQGEAFELWEGHRLVWPPNTIPPTRSN